MSVRVSNRIWDSSQHSGTELLLLLAIADFADDQGRAYPSVGTLAKKCRMTDRNANALLAKLSASGELEIQRNAGPRGTNRYRIVLADAKGVKRTSAPERSKPLKSTSPPDPEARFTPEAANTLKPASEGGEAGFPKPLKSTSPEPSVNRQEPSERDIARGSKSASRRSSIPQDFSISPKVAAWAQTKGFDRLDEHLEAFKLKAAARGYTYVDWDAAFKGAIRDDWANLRKGRASDPMQSEEIFEAMR